MMECNQRGMLGRTLYQSESTFLPRCYRVDIRRWRHLHAEIGIVRLRAIWNSSRTARAPSDVHRRRASNAARRRRGYRPGYRALDTTLPWQLAWRPAFGNLARPTSEHHFGAALSRTTVRGSRAGNSSTPQFEGLSRHNSALRIMVPTSARSIRTVSTWRWRRARRLGVVGLSETWRVVSRSNLLAILQPTESGSPP